MQMLKTEGESFIHASKFVKKNYRFTDKGTVQKVIVLPKDTSTTEELILEEVEVFRVKIFFFLKRTFD